MIQVVKAGEFDKKPKREITCHNCKCEFRYDRGDAYVKHNSNLNQQLPVYKVRCPNCEIELPALK